MNSEAEFYKRLNIQQIREFLLYGTEIMDIDTRSYDERLGTAESAFFNIMRKKFPDTSEYEEAMIPIQKYLSTISE